MYKALSKQLLFVVQRWSKILMLDAYSMSDCDELQYLAQTCGSAKTSILE
jgi:hypothetical protein